MVCNWNTGTCYSTYTGIIGDVALVPVSSSLARDCSHLYEDGTANAPLKSQISPYNESLLMTGEAQCNVQNA